MREHIHIETGRPLRVKRSKSHRTPDKQRTMSDPLEILQNEHRDGLTLLRRMETAALSIEQNGFSASAFAEIESAMKIINIAFRNHMDKEERFLFPVLARHAENPVRTLQNEHGELWRSYRELLLCVKDVEEGRVHGKSIVELLYEMKFFIEHLRAHIDRESGYIFPMAKKLLTEQEYEELRENIVPMSSIA